MNTSSAYSQSLKGLELISIVIPVFNSSKSLGDLRIEIEEALKPSIKYELIFIDDNSTDNSWEVISKLASTHSYIKGARLCKNYGQHNALLCGIFISDGQIIITMDDDGQHPAGAIPKMAQHIVDGADVIYAYPKIEKQNLIRSFASRLTKLALASAMGQANANRVSAYRAFRSDIKVAFDQYRGSEINVDVTLAWAASRYEFIPINFRKRLYGQSGYSPLKLIRHAMNMMTGFTTSPLKFASYIGFAIALMGIFLLIYLLVLWYLQGSVVPGFTFLASIIIIFSGTQLLALGIIGEYIARIHLRSMGRPPFLIREFLNYQKQPSE